MNERINELAIQAGGVWRGGYVEQANGDSVYTEQKFVSGCDMDVEQFARLLVQECVDIIEHSRIEGDASVCLVGATKCKIQQHFGVEEW